MLPTCEPYASNPKPQTLNSKPHTLNFKPQTPNHKLQTLYSKLMANMAKEDGRPHAANPVFLRSFPSKPQLSKSILMTYEHTLNIKCSSRGLELTLHIYAICQNVCIQVFASLDVMFHHVAHQCCSVYNCECL